MDVRNLILFLVVVIVSTSSARSVISRRPCSCSRPCANLPKSGCYSNLATPYPAVIETRDCECCGRNRRPLCNEQIIQPPLMVELPYGLGYFPSALPLVSQSFDPALDLLTTGAYLPVASPCDCMILAAPVSHEWAPLVKPIIL